LCALSDVPGGKHHTAYGMQLQWTRSSC